MWTLTTFLLCGLVVAVAPVEVKLGADQPFQKVRLEDSTKLKCSWSFNDSLMVTWFRFTSKNETMDIQVMPFSSSTEEQCGTQCHSTFEIASAQLNDSGLYQCFLNNSKIDIFSHGTFLHVYIPINKTLDLSEKTKNKILTIEGILLLLCVLLPATTILCQKKRQNELEKKKVAKETENIYQGLNLDECCPKYDQIERSPNRGPYQDVCNVSHEDGFQLEKP